MLSILLCFGLLFFNNNVLANSTPGPKIFEVGDVLPATTQLRISWGDMIDLYGGQGLYPKPVWDGLSENFSDLIKSNNNSFSFFEGVGTEYLLNGIPYYEWDDNVAFYSPYTDVNGVHPYMDIDTSNWSLEKRTISSYISSNEYYTYNLSWEDLNAPSGYTITFEENGGSSISNITEATELPTPLSTPTKSGYTFVNWYYDSAFTQIASAGDTIESDVTLYAKWKLNAPSGNVISFDDDELTPIIVTPDENGIIEFDNNQTINNEIAYIVIDNTVNYYQNVSIVLSSVTWNFITSAPAPIIWITMNLPSSENSITQTIDVVIEGGLFLKQNGSYTYYFMQLGGGFYQKNPNATLIFSFRDSFYQSGSGSSCFGTYLWEDTAVTNYSYMGEDSFVKGYKPSETDLENAYDIGYDVGYDDGYDVGLSLGTTTGYNTGYDEGYLDGNEEGYLTAIDEGLEEGRLTYGFYDIDNEVWLTSEQYGDIRFQDGYNIGYGVGELASWDLGFQDAILVWGVKYEGETYTATDWGIIRYNQGVIDGKIENSNTASNYLLTNFDKIFIPALVIIFIGTLLLTFARAFRRKE